VFGKILTLNSSKKQNFKIFSPPDESDITIKIYYKSVLRHQTQKPSGKLECDPAENLVFTWISVGALLIDTLYRYSM